MCCTGNVCDNTFINGITLQTLVTVVTETVTLKLAVHKIGDSFSKYIEWCFYVGVPMQPTLVQCQALCTVQNRCEYLLESLFTETSGRIEMEYTACLC